MHSKNVHMTAIYMILCIAVFFISGCCSKKQSVRQLQAQQEKLEDQFAHLQARLVDLPFPLRAAPVDIASAVRADTVCMVSYKVAMPADQLIHFYTCEMERLGWQLSMVCHAAEKLLVFDKPERLCVISMREQNLDLLVVVSMARKQSVCLD